MKTHPHPHMPLTHFALEHPYVGEWLLVAAGTLVALLLWFWNR